MCHRFAWFGLPAVLFVGAALGPAAVDAQVTIGSICVTDEWQMGDSDPGASPGGAVSATVDDLGGLNLTAVGAAGYPVYVSPGAYAGTSLAVGFSNPAGTSSSVAATQYLEYSSGSLFNSSAGFNWGFDFWFNYPTALPANNVLDDMVVVGNGGANYDGSRLCVEVGINNQASDNGLWVSNCQGNCGWFQDLGSLSAGTWYHFVYCDNAGAGQVYLGTAAGWLDGGQPLTAPSTGGGGIASINAPLSSLPADIIVGARWDYFDNSVPEFGTTGQIDALRLFSLTSPGVFNISDTDPVASPHPGDANGDGRVDVNDLTIVLSNFDQSGRAWSQGCMDGDPSGTVDVNDLTIVLANFGYGVAAPGVTAVPEPGALLLLAAGLAGLAACAWRRRKRHGLQKLFPERGQDAGTADRRPAVSLPVL
jgi:hypothetical protein